MSVAYIGRFAPSPTGPLHLGSLLAATASYLEARTQGGRWLVRMEDLDPPREIPGAADHILHTLDQYGFEWDGPVLYQSSRTEAYTAALEALKQRGLVYPCSCTRKEISDSALHGIDGPVYPGTCRHGLRPDKSVRAWRIRADEHPLTFCDAIQGWMTQHLARDTGDFVLRRADGLYAYQLAVVVDDAQQGITDIVRGADLLDSTPRQIYLQQALSLPEIRYAHLPTLTYATGEKLSKQTCAPALETGQSAENLWQALALLGQAPPADLQQAPLATLWLWAKIHWDASRIPCKRAIALPPII